MNDNTDNLGPKFDLLDKVKYTPTYDTPYKHLIDQPGIIEKIGIIVGNTVYHIKFTETNERRILSEINLTLVSSNPL